MASKQLTPKQRAALNAATMQYQLAAMSKMVTDLHAHAKKKDSMEELNAQAAALHMHEQHAASVATGRAIAGLITGDKQKKKLQQQTPKS
jgi:hypothetical protein